MNSLHSFLSFRFFLSPYTTNFPWMVYKTLRKSLYTPHSLFLSLPFSFIHVYVTSCSLVLYVYTIAFSAACLGCKWSGKRGRERKRKRVGRENVEKSTSFREKERAFIACGNAKHLWNNDPNVVLSGPSTEEKETTLDLSLFFFLSFFPFVFLSPSSFFFFISFQRFSETIGNVSTELKCTELYSFYA